MATFEWQSLIPLIETIRPEKPKLCMYYLVLYRKYLLALALNNLRSIFMNVIKTNFLYKSLNL